MTNTEAGRRHSEALRLFEAGLKAFHEATVRQATLSDVEDIGKEGPPASPVDPHPSARVPEPPRDLVEAR